MDDYMIGVLCMIMFVVGYFSKIICCSDNTQQIIDGLDEDLEMLQIRQQEIVRNIENANHIQAVPIQPSAPSSVYISSE